MGILAGFLISSIQKAREAGWRMNCLNNLRQISMAAFLYLDDNNYKFPSGIWTDPFNRYIDNVKTWYCPKQPKITYTPGFSTNPFAFNNNLIGVSIDNVKSKSETILASDSTKFEMMVIDNFYICGVPFFIPQQRHSGGDNYAFVDGHMKWLSFNEAWTQHGPASASNWFDTN